ncbi:HIT domain-containing protein [bacterium]|nr:HIT domain-containing protein [bacterium]
MEKLWAPWRIEYIARGDLDNDECFLCEKQKDTEHDDDNYVLYRGKFCYVLLNIYPYNNGHLMIAPYRHIGEFEKLIGDEFLEMMKLTKIATSAIEESMGAQGFNIGFNLGRVAGAGRADHIHLHIVPRWNGDTNFMPIIGETKVLSEALRGTYERLRPYFQNE